jgi:hypothetical protein
MQSSEIALTVRGKMLNRIFPILHSTVQYLLLLMGLALAPAWGSDLFWTALLADRNAVLMPLDMMFS